MRYADLEAKFIMMKPGARACWSCGPRLPVLFYKRASPGAFFTLLLENDFFAPGNTLFSNFFSDK